MICLLHGYLLDGSGGNLWTRSVLRAMCRAGEEVHLTYAVMPHGSAFEYAVRPDARFRRLAANAFDRARRVFVISDEVAARVESLPGSETAALGQKMTRLDLGVDTAAFVPVDAGSRAGNAARVKALLTDVPRGRTAAQAAALVSALDAGADVRTACAAVGPASTR